MRTKALRHGSDNGPSVVRLEITGFFRGNPRRAAAIRGIASEVVAGLASERVAHYTNMIAVRNNSGSIGDGQSSGIRTGANDRGKGPAFRWCARPALARLGRLAAGWMESALSATVRVLRHRSPLRRWATATLRNLPGRVRSS